MATKKTFVVAFISFFDNELAQKKVKAVSPLAASKKFLLEKFGKDESAWIMDPKSMEDLKSGCFNCDSAIDAIEV